MSFSIIQKIWRLMTSAERRSALIVLGLMIVGMGFETLGVGLVVPAVTLVTEPAYVQRVQNLLPVLDTLDQPALVLGAMLLLAATFLAKNLFLAFLAFWQMRFVFGLPAQLSQRLFATYLRQPYTFHLQRNSAELLRNVTTEVSIFANNAMLPGLTLLSELLVLIGLCTLLVVIEPVGALVVVGVLGGAAWAFHGLTRTHIARWGVARQHHEGLRIQHVQQGLGGAKEIRVLGREAVFLEQYKTHNMQGARVAQLHATLQQLPRLWLELLATGGLATLVAVMLAQGRPLASVLPTLALFAAAAFRLLPSANRAIGALQSLRYGMPAVENLYHELYSASPVVDESRSAEPPFREVLQLDGVGFAYPGAAEPTLTALSLKIHRGESVGFIGTSGAGKSTLVDIILGLLTPQQGTVKVDGRDIGPVLRSWQDEIGYVPQSIYLTDDTLRRNVAFGLPDAQIDDTAVWRALRAAQLEEFVRSMPDGLDSVVGERGVRLSGGQRQRIGIARALYHDPEVLVLDEATSSLDTATEHSVMEAVDALHGTKTIIVVAHRLSTVEHCDRLYRLARGRVVEQGSPAALLAQR